MEYKVLALDLDGTLTNSKKKITIKTKKAINKAIERGIKVILASGRPVIGISNLAEELKLYDKGGYILAYNGGQIIDCKNNKVIFEKFIPMEYYRDICECAHKFNLDILTYDSECVVAENSDGYYVKKEAYNNAVSIKSVEKLDEYIKNPVIKFMIVGEPERIETAITYIKEKFDDKLSIFLSEPYFMEITSLGIEKSSSLEVLMKHLGISKEQLIACGDGLNDIPMLQYAGLGVAMENAYDETKKYADYITLSNEEDGVGYAINKFILKEDDSEISF